MSSAATSLMKPLSMAESCCLTSIPTLFSNKTPNSFLSLPSSKPIKLSHLSYASPSSFHSWVLLRKKNSAFNIVPLVAQTSDWAQEEEEKEQQGLNWENQDEESGEDETEGQIAASASGDENWEGEGEVGDGAEELYPDPPEEAKLFVGNLPYDIDSEALAQLFNQAGIVEIAEVIYNRETDQSRGFGFVTMSTVEEAEKAVDMFHRYDINGRFLTVNKAAPRGERPERTPRTFETSYRVYVGNLPWQVDNARLEQVFSEHGKVVDARVVYDRETQRSRGFGFVTMSSETELQDAIAALDGQSLDGRAIRVNVAEERPRRSSF